MIRLLAALWLAIAGGWQAPLASAAPGQSSSESVIAPAWQELEVGQRADLADFADRWDTLPAQRRLRILRRHEHWRNLPEAERRTMREGVRNFRRMPPRLRMKMRASLDAVRALPVPQQRRLRGLWRSMTPEQRREWLERGGPGLAAPPTAVRRVRKPLD